MGGMLGRSEEGVHRKDAKGAKVEVGRVECGSLRGRDTMGSTFGSKFGLFWRMVHGV